VQFCLHLHHGAGLASSCSSWRFSCSSGRSGPRAHRAAACPVAWPAPPARPRHGPGAFHDMAGIQTLPAQQRTLLTIRRRVVSGHNLQLVLRSKRPPTGPLRDLRGRDVPFQQPGTAQDPRSRALGRAWARSLSRRGVSIPALGSLIVRGRVPQPRLAERGISPALNPRTSRRPSGANDRRVSVIRSPPTGSTTMSTARSPAGRQLHRANRG
jgi:hypothetical protein